MLKRTVCWSLLLAAATTVAAAPPTTRPAEPAHLRDAEQLVADVQPADNDYVFGGGVVRWKSGDAVATCRADCSGLLTAVVRHAYGWTLERVNQVTGRNRPRALEWHDAIANSKGGLRPVPRLADVEPGDLLVIRYQPQAQRATGHVMIADAAQVPHVASAPIVPGATQWDVVVIDSAKGGHGAGDTRARPTTAPVNGVGRGTLRVYARTDGTVAGYAWSDAADAKFHPQSEHDLIVGRFDAGAVERRK